MKKNPLKSRTPRGYAILIILIFLAVISTICASLLTWVTFEKKMTRRTAAIAELKASTETLLNYAAAQAQGNRLNIPYGIKAAPINLFKGGSEHVTLNRPEEQEIIVTQLARMTDSGGAGIRFYINPNAPINRNDDLRDKNVYRDLCFIAAKGAATDPLHPTQLLHAYGMMVLERRAFSVFNYLAFFDVAQFRVTNPGSNILLDGPIQSNQGIYFESSNHPSTVYMDSTVHTPGKLEFSGSTSAGKFMITDGTFLANGSPKRVDLLKPGTSSLRESSDGTSFNNFMLNSTKGFLKTGAVGAPLVELEGLNYIDDSADTSIPSNFRIANNRRIDPPNPTLRNSTDPQYADARIAESAKTAYEARIYTYVETNGTTTVFTSQKNAESYKNAADKTSWKNSNGDKYVAETESSGFISMPYVQRYNDGGTDYTTPAKNTDLARGAIFDSQQKKTVALVDVDLGSLKAKLETNGGLRLGNGTTWDAKGASGWNGVMYVDVQNPATRPSAPVKDMKTGYYLDPATKKPSAAITADTALRIPTPSLNITNTAQTWDGTTLNDTTGLTGVRIKNAKEVPGALIGDPGFTLATNTATYTVGSVNADGKTSTGTTALQDDQNSVTAGTKAIPAAIFSDKNVVLSEDFNNPAYDLDLYVPRPSAKPSGMSAAIYNAWPFTGPKASSTSYALDGQDTSSGVNTNGHYQYQRDPGNRGAAGNPGLGAGTRTMELSCAFIVGDDDSSNKGIHTLLSYLQPFNTSTDTLRMRGSVIGIYKSRYFNAPAGSFNNYYVAPLRTFGYSSLLKAGKMPPASPTISTYRRVRQFNITESEFNALKTAPNTVDGWLNVLGNKY